MDIIISEYKKKERELLNYVYIMYFVKPYIGSIAPVSYCNFIRTILKNNDTSIYDSDDSSDDTDVTKDVKDVDVDTDEDVEEDIKIRRDRCDFIILNSNKCMRCRNIVVMEGSLRCHIHMEFNDNVLLTAYE